MLQKVKVWADNTFRYRKFGSRSWITLRGGEWYTLEFSEGERVEFGSTSTVTNIKIQGAVSKVFVENSELTSLEDSFKNNSELRDVEIRASTQITNINNAFENSGVVNVILPTRDIKNADNAFKDTQNIETLSFEADSLDSSNSMFERSNIKQIDSLTKFKGTKAKNMFAGSNNLVKIGEQFDARFLDNDSFNSLIFDDQHDIISELDILISRKRIALRKKYLRDPDNIINEDYNFEMDIKSKDFITHEPISDINDSLDAQIDSNYNLEMDIENKTLITREEIRDINDSLDKTVDNDYNFEMDIETKALYKRQEIKDIEDGLDKNFDNNYTIEFDKKTTNSIPINIRENYTIETGLDQTSDSDNNTLELNIVYKNNNIPMFERERYTVNTGLDVSLDPANYTFEMDIIAKDENIDLFEDNSCIFFINKDSTAELYGQSILTKYTNNVLVSNINNTIYKSASGRLTGSINSNDTASNIYKSMYARIIIKNQYGYGPTDSYVPIVQFLVDGTTDIKYEVYIYNNEYNDQLKIGIRARIADNDDLTTIIESDVLGHNYGGTIEQILIQPTGNTDEYELKYRGNSIGTYTLSFTDQISDTANMQIQSSVDNSDWFQIIGLYGFNRALTQDDIQYLDSI